MFFIFFSLYGIFNFYKGKDLNDIFINLNCCFMYFLDYFFIFILIFYFFLVNILCKEFLFLRFISYRIKEFFFDGDGKFGFVF